MKIQKVCKKTHIWKIYDRSYKAESKWLTNLIKNYGGKGRFKRLLNKSSYCFDWENEVRCTVPG